MRKPILLMTRPQPASERFVAQFPPEVLARMDVIHAPLMRISALAEVAEIGPDMGVIFSSANGVEFAPKGQGRRAYCVGRKTADRATAHGWQVMQIAQDSDALVAQMSQQAHQGPLVHLAGRHRRGDIAQRLANLGLNVQLKELYDQALLPLQPAARAALTGEAVVIVPLFSPRSAAQFAAEIGSAPKARILTMSGAVADALNGAFAGQVRVATAPTAIEMRRGVENLLCDDWLP